MGPYAKVGWLVMTLLAVCAGLTDLSNDGVGANWESQTIASSSSQEGAKLFLREVSPTEAIVDDFEGGFANWTLSGNCWRGSQPAEASRFRTQVSGIEGSRFAFSFNSSNQDTGVASSKSFVLNKRYMDFKIAGGAFKGETCINLLVDGKVVRSSTGDNTLALVRKCWDLQTYSGRTASLEIVDKSTSNSYGFVAVDDIRLSSVPMGLSTSELLRRPYDWGNPTDPLVGGFKPSISLSTSLYISENGDAAIAARKVGAEFTPEFLSVLDLQRMMIVTDHAIPYRQGEAFAICASKIEKLCDSTCKKLSFEPSHFQCQYMAARALCIWLASSSDTDREKVSKEEHQRRKDPRYLFSMPRLKLFCSGTANIILAIAKELSQTYWSECSYVGGWQRDFGQIVTWRTDHAWNVFKLDGEIYLPADVSFLRNKFEWKAPVGPSIDRFALPVSRECLELFYSLHFGYFQAQRGKKQAWDSDVPLEPNPFFTVGFKDWANLDTSAFRKLENLIMKT